MKSLGVGLIGFGQIARRKYLPAIQNSKRSHIQAVCCSTESHAQTAAASLSCPRWTADYHEILSDQNVGAVIIASPHPLHGKMTAEAIKAGKHVLVEKPMATNWEDVQLVMKASQGTDRTLMVLPYDATSDFLTVLSLLREDKIGKISVIQANVGGSGPARGRDWKLRMHSSGGGVLIGHGVYALSQIATILGPAKRLFALGGTLVTHRKGSDENIIDSDIDDHWAIMLEFASGQVANVRACWAYGQPYNMLEIHGHKGSVFLYKTQDTSKVFFRTAGMESGSELNASLNMVEIPVSKIGTHVFKHFLDCIESGKVPTANLSQASHVAEQMFLAKESSKSKKMLELTTTFQSWWQPESDIFNFSDVII
jgi:UDP-N-acetylglucosamine 3-dehydrogenase